MKKILMLLAAIAVMAAPAFAQNAFSDVPSDHWAYDAVSQLAARGIVEGYPDGTFKGKRTLTRYEYAVIVARLLPYISENGGINPNAFVKKSDLNGYAKLSDIKAADVSGCATKADLDAIAKLANEFKAELTALGVDVNALNAEVNALKTRVAAIEDEQARVKITGDLTVAGVYAVAKDGEALLDIDRGIVKSDSQGVKLTKDFQINVKGRVNNNINAYLTLVAGDYMKKNLTRSALWETDVDKAEEIAVVPYYMYAAADFGKYGNFNLGRIPMQLNKYVGRQ